MSGAYGGATHRLASVYEFDPMDFPGPIWLDVPHATASVHSKAKLDGGDFGYTPQVDPQKFEDLNVSEFNLSLDAVEAAFAGASDVLPPGAPLPAWDVRQLVERREGPDRAISGPASARPTTCSSPSATPSTRWPRATR